MKFIDELDIERVNQTLNFETSDCKITGGCDIFTTKPVASDKKLYKTIDQHLETILQENESFKAAVHHQQQLQLQSSPVEANAIPVTPNDNTRRDSSSFWEQKRRMSITDPLYAINNNIVNYTNNFNHNSNNNSNNNSTNNVSLTNAPVINGSNGSNNGPLVASPFIKSVKLNDQNLKDLVMNSESEYASSSSMESTNRAGSNSGITKPGSKRRTSSNSSLQSFKLTSLRRPSLKDADMNVNIGPFGPIREPASRRTFAYLIAILNASYPDHDFSSLEPTDFIRSSLKTFISKFENSLYSLGKKPESWIWESISSHMTLSDCVVYQFNPTKSFLEDEPGYLWSLIGFLFNKKRKRVAFLYLICSRVKAISGDYNEDTMKPMRQFTIDYDDGFEGEYDLANDDENAIADDSEDEF
ncbi:similar to Saccharomyces cerevisiae YDR005C MAF1 Negative regulator of RNA polymerase III [Maudiozyma barnettii]|uniref:Similar to Saccharomyces cerevisiae YDR005C MAF1 Negative regulator of RNA polymerase III n=1 Tax=Maudiozyma barnettii TaxID=61262 RepID=A0A8H2VDA5_9SACH|nr:RNA polymerase III-inhibiting protein MAF1 [Kazachstania barnettii]CAB4253158.1 similar to Saccharomyces cerevisiae YDR005C MAF1 Negative regulator of RNA polymerase III [Kazachstania barnettii]CAD1780306.1 similar to Saccharomyces cerevisiae YDR005C MAF1 Negative regulator of RNA polymerase III [Kazachstania barnettii]